MAMEDEEGMWATTTSPSASPPTPAASTCSFISTALSLSSSRLRYSGASPSPSHSSDNNYNRSMGCDGRGGYSNAVAASLFSSAGSYPHLAPSAPLDFGPASRALEREAFLGHGRRHLGRSRSRSRQRRQHRPPQESHDQEPGVRRALPCAQAGPRLRARRGGAVPAAGEREAPRQVRAAEGVSGGAGAGEEDPAEGALVAILISDEEKKRS